MDMDRAGGATARREPSPVLPSDERHRTPGDLSLAIAGMEVERAASPQADRWLICESAVERTPDGRRHGYVFESREHAHHREARVPIRAAGRMRHAAALERSGLVFLTEDRGLEPDPRLKTVGGCLYRYSPGPRSTGVALADTRGRLHALKLRDEFHADMTGARRPGIAHPVTWVPVPDPDHGDDSDERRDRVPGFTPTRIQAQDNGAAYFDRPAHVWGNRVVAGKLYLECMASGPRSPGQVWIYDAGRSTLTLG